MRFDRGGQNAWLEGALFSRSAVSFAAGRKGVGQTL